ncbi:MAG: hypothetical protein ACR2QJ_01560 [Geminicoccaceae bacterium]
MADRRGFFDETAEYGIGRGASADTCRTGTSSLSGKLPAQAFRGLALFFGVASLDCVDPIVAFGIDLVRLSLLRLVG